MSTSFQARGLTLEASGVSFLTSSSIFIALNGLLVTIFSFMLYEIPVDFTMLLCSFLITFSVYSFNKITDVAEDKLNNPYRVKLIRGCEKMWLMLPPTSLSASLLIGALRSLLTVPILLTPFIAAFFYSFKLSPSIPRLKEIFFVKSFVVALSWALVGSLLPTAVGSAAPPMIPLIFTFIFITIFVNTVLFDVRDVDGDRASGIKTIPIVLGVDRTRRLLSSLNSLLVVWLFSSLALGEFSIYIPALAFSVAYGFLLIKIFCREGHEMGVIQDLMVDGEWVPLVALMMVTKLIT
jgi:4-hydroxybenzoate polyprenyltransferase